MAHDDLGARMKDRYEFRTRSFLPRGTHTVIRLDGKAFHTYTRGLDRPFDQQLMDDMTETARFLCHEVQGTAFAYTQSDEISLVLTDFATAQTEAWFDGGVQKIVSVAASLATAKFNELRPGKLAFFDARVFVIPPPLEVINYFIWRQKDAMRNSISMTAQAHFSPKQLHGKNTGQMQDLLFTEKGVNWNDMPDRFKRGTLLWPELREAEVTYTDKRDGAVHTTMAKRRVWEFDGAPPFTADRIREWLLDRLIGSRA